MHDPSQIPYLRLYDIDDWFGISESTGAAKVKEIRSQHHTAHKEQRDNEYGCDASNVFPCSPLSFLGVRGDRIEIWLTRGALENRANCVTDCIRAETSIGANSERAPDDAFDDHNHSVYGGIALG